MQMQAFTYARFAPDGPSSLHAWLRGCGYIHYGKQDPDHKAAGFYGHTLFYGGSLAVPPDEWHEMHRRIAHDFERGHLDAISEVATQPVFRAFFEFDPPDDWRWTEDDVLQIARCVQRAVFLRSDSGGASESKVCQLYVSTKNTGPSGGAHMVLPAFCVDVRRMAHLRRTLLCVLKQDGPSQPNVATTAAAAAVNWDSIVDESVSNKPGHVHLRKNLSAKCRKTNAPCFPGRLLFEPSFYTLTWVLAADGRVDVARTKRDKADLVSQLDHTSILSADQRLADGWISAPDDQVEEPKSWCRRRDELPLDHATSVLLLVAIREANPAWAQLELRSVLLVSRGGFCVQVQGPGAHACLNRAAADGQGNATHRQATIWFSVTRSAGIVQRCMGSNHKTELRSSGKPCGSFASRPYRVARATWMRLFCCFG